MNVVADERSVTPVIGGILVVAVVVVLAAVVGASFFGFADELDELTGEMTYGDNLVDNADFENGNTAWVEYDGGWVPIKESRIVPGDGVDGSNGVRLDRDEYIEQDLDTVLLPDAEYRICISFRLESASGGRAWVGIQHSDGGPGNHLAIWEVTDSDYQRECGYFQADRELDDITAWAYTNDDGPVSITVDDYLLQRTRYLTDNRN